VGLEIGGDDYVVKPFSTRELVARIKAVLRRLHPPSAGEPAEPPPATPENDLSRLFRYGPIEIDNDKFCVRCDGTGIILTRQEFRLLELLVRHPGRVFTREQVLDQAWGDGGIVTDRTIDVHIKTLRKKFATFDFIETVRGIGYRAREI